ncbi:MAG: alanine racemase [Clostridia bacterium]|nr:alanine racemase [Clostridia bacterium]
MSFLEYNKDENFLRRTWAEIDLTALRENYENIRIAASGGAKIMAVVKADAYGHGAVRCSKVLDECGADWFAVSNLEEALELRRGGIEKPILILGYTPPQYAASLAVNNISQAVFSLSYAESLSAEAVKLGLQVNIHIKVDTGMSRIGFVYHDSVDNDDSIDEIAAAVTLDGLYPEGIFTHFARADEVSGEVYTRLQFALFMDAIARLEGRGIRFEIRHCANSAACLDYPEMHLDMVRTGIIMYGLWPSGEVKNKIKLTPVMTVKSVVAQIKTLDAETPVSYGGTALTQDGAFLATIPIGYADGYSRRLSNVGEMLVGGERAKILGRVCMDQTVVDVSKIENVNVGDEVTVFGKAPAMTTDDVAKTLGTINYEIVCDVGKRVPRIYG